MQVLAQSSKFLEPSAGCHEPISVHRSGDRGQEPAWMREEVVEKGPWLQAQRCGGHGQNRGSAALPDLAAAVMGLLGRCGIIV